ncbi:Hpt domain-containing protein [Paraburkholderia fungorum]|uniref:Hpt domain-containing protein n=1 Tax=Paraburkholderia fungorum TaxID=134537 RepID=A0AAP5QCN9_9BURK|nr:Hpt domain-containing protein [Paraburkholderia fungorum]MDT8839812.1 Hpt domain-containing protein [Paraburkholderia fungorum]
MRLDDPRGDVALTTSELRALGNAIHELACGDVDMAHHFMRLLIDTNRTTLTALCDAVHRSSWDQMCSAAHKLAGSMRMLDCTNSLAVLAQFETMARRHQRDHVLAVLPAIIDLVGNLESALYSLLAGTEHTDYPVRSS